MYFSTHVSWVMPSTKHNTMHKSFSSQKELLKTRKKKKKGRKPNSHLHQKTKNSLLPHIHVFLQKTPSLNLQWPKTCVDIMKYCQDSLSCVLVYHFVWQTPLLLTPRSIALNKFLYAGKSLWPLFYFQLLKKRVLQKQSPFCFYGKLQTRG